MWEDFEQGRTIGEVGSEGGIIIRDEEYKYCCRITLEKEGAIAPYAITCGVYGLMVHTTFVEDKEEVQQKYNAMKDDLKSFIDSEANNEEWCNAFVSKYS